MKWIKASEQLPEATIRKDYLGKDKYGRRDIYTWDNMVQFFRPHIYEESEMVEWLD